MQVLHRIFAATVLLLGFASQSHAERIKDMAQVQGVRTNQLVGYGLVVGLDGTGDQTSQAPFTIQSLTNMLAQLGVVVPTNVTPQLKNIAAVAVHAVMPARPSDAPISFRNVHRSTGSVIASTAVGNSLCSRS